MRGYDQGYRQYVGNGNGRYGNGRYENDDYGKGRYGNGSYNNNAELNRGYQQGIRPVQAMASAARATTRSVHATIGTPRRRPFGKASCAAMTRAIDNTPTVVTETAMAGASRIFSAVSSADRNGF